MILILQTICIIVVIFLIFSYFNQEKEEIEKEQGTEAMPDPKTQKKTKESQQKTQSLKELMKQQKTQEKQKEKKTFSLHHMCYTSFKGFSNKITDFQIINDKLYITSQDKTMKIFKLNQMQKGQDPFFYLYQTSVDYPTAVSSYNNIIALALTPLNSIKLLKFNESENKKDQFSEYVNFAQNLHKDKILNIKLENNVVISIGDAKDTFIKISDFKGNLIQSINSNQIMHYGVIFSDRYFFLKTWVSEVFEIKMDKSNSFKEVKNVMTLGGHKSKILQLNANLEATRTITISKEQLKLWKTDVRYEEREDPKVLKQFDQHSLTKVEPKSVAVVTFNRNNYFALGVGNSFMIYEFETQQELMKIENAHQDNKDIESLKFYQWKDQLFILSQVDDRINCFEVKV